MGRVYIVMRSCVRPEGILRPECCISIRLSSQKKFLPNPCAIAKASAIVDESNKRAVSSVGRAPALQAGCHQFESGTAHILKKG